MTRRTIFTASFIVFVGVIIWVASSSIRIPELSFDEASKVGDHKTKVIVPTKVVKEKEISDQGNVVVFYAVDRNGTEAKVTFEGTDALSASQLGTAAQRGSEITVAGHYCGDGFKATHVNFPAY